MLSFKSLKRKNFYIRAALVTALISTGFYFVNSDMYKASAKDFLSNIFWYISPSDPYLQNWSDTVSISVDDNWDNFIAITGQRGDDLTTGVGVDPQTVLADGIGTPLDVIANQSNPNTLIQGGVAEFDGIPNPTVALKGDSTADAPHLLIRINNKSCPDSKVMTVGYNIRDLDSTANNAVQQVSLQWRLGDTGNFTNVPGAFVADATDPNAATRITSVFTALPHMVLTQDRLWIRILTTNAAGNDEWIGIDDISVGCFASTAASADVSGRVIGGNEKYVKGAMVTVYDRLGGTITVKTNQFGFFRFEGLYIGEVYMITARAKNNTYAPKIVVLSSDTDGLDFIPETSNDLQTTESIPKGKSPPK